MFIKLRILFTRLIGTGTQFVIHVLLGRLTGAGAVGVYTVFVSWTNIFASVISLGFPTSALKYTSRNTEAPGGVYEILKIAFIAGLVLMAVLMLIVSKTFPSLYLFWATILAGFLFTSVRVISESLKGLRETNRSLALEFIVAPVGFVLLVFVTLPFFDHNLGKDTIYGLYTLSLAVTLGFSMILIYHRIRPKESRDWKSAVGHRALAGYWGISLVNSYLAAAPYVLLPFFVTNFEIGIFSASHKLVTLFGTVNYALTAHYAPSFSRLYSKKNRKELKNVYHDSRFTAILVYAALAAVILLFPERILGLYGSEFTIGAWILVIMVAGRFVNALFGPVEALLMMSDRQGSEFKISIGTAILFTALAIPALHHFGTLGLVIVHTVIYALRPVASYAVAHRHLSLRAS